MLSLLTRGGRPCLLLLCLWAPMRAPAAIATPLAAALSMLEAPTSAPLPALRRRHGEALREQLTRLYADQHTLWLRDGAPSSAARALAAVLADAAIYGLVPGDYDAAGLEHRLATQPAPDGEPERTDAELTLAALSLVEDLHAGRIDPRVAGFELPPDRQALDPVPVVQALAGGADAAATLAAVEPAFIHYRLLRQALAHYRALAADRTLAAAIDALPAPSRHASQAEDYAGAPALRQVLAAFGCLDPAAVAVTGTRLDRDLSAGITCFQRLHGLDPDGHLGRATWQALTVPLAQRVRQIELSLERWRWLPRLQPPSILVNIPAFRLFEIPGTEDREAQMLRMDVIVGQEFPETQTPVFAAEMRTVVFQPYWDVPRSILLRELLPKLRRDPHYLDSEGLEIVRGESDEARPVPYGPAALAGLAAGTLRLRQRPGPKNALGPIKFLFPNAHDVYMHSTPAKALFQRSRRAFSHGCIRLSDPVALAERVLQGTPGDWTREHIEAAMAGNRQQRVTLARPVHVLILYTTALASEDGAMHFYEDLYGHDRQLAELLNLR